VCGRTSGCCKRPVGPGGRTLPDPRTEPELDVARILEVFEKHDVRFVLIGGFAALLYGSPYVTTDVDVVPQRRPANLDRLSQALGELKARVWTSAEPDGVPFRHDGRTLGKVEVWNLVTDAGRLDITFSPSGTAGFDDLSRHAESMIVLDVPVPVASLADVIRSKEAAGREKDRLVLPTLRRILRETGPPSREG
jgi:hypothetical protein